MLNLIAIYFALHANTDNSNPLFLSHCYSSLSEYRPNTINIVNVYKDRYEYKLWSLGKWTQTFSNKSYAIENIYIKEVNCP